MVDTVDTITLLSDTHVHKIRLTNESDGTGESNVNKINISGLSAKHGYVVSGVDIERIYGQVGQFNYVVLRWDATTDDEIQVMAPGSFDFDYLGTTGPLRDPQSAGFTGDVFLTTDGAINGASYNIVIEARVRYQ